MLDSTGLQAAFERRKQFLHAVLSSQTGCMLKAEGFGGPRLLLAVLLYAFSEPLPRGELWRSFPKNQGRRRSEQPS